MHKLPLTLPRWCMGRECEYAKNAKWNKKGYRICPASHMEITDDGFCSYGVRENGHEHG